MEHTALCHIIVPVILLFLKIWPDFKKKIELRLRLQLASLVIMCGQLGAPMKRPESSQHYMVLEDASLLDNGWNFFLSGDDDDCP